MSDASEARIQETRATTSDEAILSRVWEEVLGVEYVAPYDDFFSLGGDSLLAVKVVGMAREIGLNISLLDLFKAPTIRAVCSVSGGVDDHAEPGGDLLSPADRALVGDDVEEVFPANKLQLGLIFEQLLSGGELCIAVVSRTVALPLREPLLRAVIGRLTERHPALRSRFDLASYSEAVQVIERSVVMPFQVQDRISLTKEESAREHEQIMLELSAPFDAESAPLIRMHVAALTDSSFQLSYSFHHAILDGWSESVLTDELVRTYAKLLNGETLDLTDATPPSDYVSLERVARRNEKSADFFRALPLANGDVLSRTGGEKGQSAEKTTAVIPSSVVDKLTELSRAWGVPIKSLLLAANGAALAEVSGCPEVVIGLAMSGRTEAVGGELTLGLFLNTLPCGLNMSGMSWRTAGEHAFKMERDLLQHRRFPASDIRSILGRVPYTSVFNYVNFHLLSELLSEGLLIGEEDVRERSSFGIRVEVINDPKARGLVLEVTVDEILYGEQQSERLSRAILVAIARLADGPDGYAQLN